MDPFVQQLASLCREHVTRSKWVFVPSHALGRTIGERIALEGTNWLNLRFVTPQVRRRARRSCLACFRGHIEHCRFERSMMVH